MYKSQSQLLGQAIEIKEEVIPNANTAERVGGMLEDIVHSTAKPYDPNAPYSPGQYIFYADFSWRCLFAVAIGESPLLAPQKWRIQGGKSLYRRGAGVSLIIRSLGSDLGDDLA